MTAELTIRLLTLSDAPSLSRLLLSQPREYLSYFTPFRFDETDIQSLLAQKVEDAYFGIFWQDRLAGFFMLRGWDQGYDIPAYGVVIDQAYSGQGLGQLTLEYARAYCQLRGCPQIMLKVHPQNVAAKHIYEKAGFVQNGFDPNNHHLIYHLELKR